MFLRLFRIVSLWKKKEERKKERRKVNITGVKTLSEGSVWFVSMVTYKLTYRSQGVFFFVFFSSTFLLFIRNLRSFFFLHICCIYILLLLKLFIDTFEVCY